MKRCSKCGELKELSEFYKDSRLKSGYRAACKCCKLKYDQSDAGKKSYQKYARSEKGKIVQKKADDKRRVLMPEKHRARTMVNQYLMDGKILKPKLCEHCGEDKKLEAHHHDYSKPLDVIWVCVKCHRKEHKRLKER